MLFENIEYDVAGYSEALASLDPAERETLTRRLDRASAAISRVVEEAMRDGEGRVVVSEAEISSVLRHLLAMHLAARVEADQVDDLLTHEIALLCRGVREWRAWLTRHRRHPSVRAMIKDADFLARMQGAKKRADKSKPEIREKPGNIMRKILVILACLSMAACETQQQSLYASLGTANGPVALSPTAELLTAGFGATVGGAAGGAIPSLEPGYCYVKTGAGEIFRMSASSVGSFSGCVIACANPSPTGHAAGGPLTLPRWAACPASPLFPHPPLQG
jgi:hypothetical protein